MKTPTYALLALGMAGLLGCGGRSDQVPTVDVSGTIMLDGQPHGPASVKFTPVRQGEEEEKRPTIMGEAGDDGKFTVTTYEQGDGAPPGEYNVTLGPPQKGGGSTDPAAMMAAIGGGPSSEELNITIPAEGTDSLELNFNSTKDRKQRPNAPLGGP